MALSDDMQLLSALSLFQGLEQDELRLIAFGAEHRNLGPGQVLFREHSPAECAFVVVKGQVELSNTGRDGTQKVAAIVGPGAMLSELALATMVERKYTAVALDDTEVMRIPRQLFHRLLEEYPRLGSVMQDRIRRNLVALATGVKNMEERFR